MLVNKELTIYDSWNLNYPSIPSRSRLFPLEPIGIGTPYVESLTSYLTRLAESHTVLLGDLVGREIKTIIPKTYKSKDLFCTRHPSGTANSTGAIARYLLLALKQLTLREELEHLTLLKWSQVFSKGNLINPVKKWCSVCYQEQYERNKPIYEHLLWFFKTVDACPIHQILLQTICPHCHQAIPSLARNSRSGYCSHCEQWLVSNQRNNTNIVKDWDLWVANNVGEILVMNSQIFESVHKDRISNSFQKCIEQVTEGNITAFARLIKFPKNQVWEWTNGKVIPRLDVLLKISHLMGLSLADFLTKDDFKVNYSSVTKLSDKGKKNRGKQKFNYLLAETSLKKIISDSSLTPVSLSAVARQLGYHRRTLTKNFPELCKQISENYLEYKKSQRIQRIKECCLEVEQAVVKLNSESIYPSEANVSKILSRPGNLREKEVREALSKSRQMLGMNK
jgi:hypothetical protein